MSIFELHGVENCFCAHRVPLTRLQGAILRLFRGAMARAHGPGSHYVGPHGCSSTRRVTKSSPKPIPEATKGFCKNSNFKKFSNAHWPPHVSPSVLKYPCCHQIITHTHPRGDKKSSQKNRVLKTFQALLGSLHNSIFGAIGGHMARATWAYRPLRVLKYPSCHQMINHTHPRGDRRVSNKVKILKTFQCHETACTRARER